MLTMSKYCKAYPVDRFRAFPSWPLSATSATEETGYYFLHDNHVVATGVFKDEGIVFDAVTPEWIDFCEKTLNFQIPEEYKEAD